MRPASAVAAAATAAPDGLQANVIWVVQEFFVVAALLIRRFLRLVEPIPLGHIDPECDRQTTTGAAEPKNRVEFNQRERLARRVTDQAGPSIRPSPNGSKPVHQRK